MTATTTHTYEDIAKRAYYLWEKQGRPVGEQIAQDNWMTAERELSNETVSSAKTKPGSTTRIPSSGNAAGTAAVAEMNRAVQKGS